MLQRHCAHIRQTTAGQQVTTFTYDAAGELASVSYSNGSSRSAFVAELAGVWQGAARGDTAAAEDLAV